MAAQGYEPQVATLNHEILIVHRGLILNVSFLNMAVHSWNTTVKLVNRCGMLLVCYITVIGELKK